MSYAQVAAKNANQSPEEARAPPPPEIIPRESAEVTSLIDVDSARVSVVPPDFPNQDIKTHTQATRLELEDQAAEEHAIAEAEGKKQRAKEKAKEAIGKGKGELPNDPVEIVNGVLVATVLGAVGWGAYRKYSMGELSWKVVGLWGAGVAAFAVVDVIATRFIQEERAKKSRK